jgi:oxalate decarboxylase/phosphoglucose isomerase-like protein (cupin superfamily)
MIFSKRKFNKHKIKYVLFLAVITFICYNIFLNYSGKDKYDKPIIYKNLNLKKLNRLTFSYFLKNFGDEKIWVDYSTPNVTDMEKKETTMLLKEYINDKINDKNWYFKTEDKYDFLKDIGKLNFVKKQFETKFNGKNIPGKIIKTNVSFWMGGKNSTTSWHNDTEDLSFIYVIQGKKKINFISPKYNENMYEKNMYTHHANWSHVNFKNPDYEKHPKYKQVKITSYTLEKGDCCYIPPYWWHSVENLDKTIAVTYHIYRLKYVLLQPIIDFFRIIYYYLNGAKMYYREEE